MKSKSVKSVSQKALLDIGNAASRCAMCRNAMSGEGMTKKNFNKIKSLAKRTAVRLADLSKNEKDVLKQAGKLIMAGEKPKEMLEGIVSLVADKFSQKLSGKGYMTGTGFSSSVGREFSQAGAGIFDDLLGVAALMDPTGLVRTAVIGKTALGLGMAPETEGSGINIAGQKVGRGALVTGQLVGRGEQDEQDGGKFLGINWLPRPSEISDTVGSVIGIPKGVSSGLLRTVGLGKEKKPRKPSAWIAHVRSYAKEHGCTYKEAMSRAKETYKK